MGYPKVTRNADKAEPSAARVPPQNDTCGRPQQPDVTVALAVSAFFFLAAASPAVAAGPTLTETPTVAPTIANSQTETPTPAITPTAALTLVMTATAAPASALSAAVPDTAAIGDVNIIASRNTPIPFIVLPEFSGNMSQVMDASVPELQCSECGTFSQPPTIADGEGGFITVRIVHSEFAGGRDTLYAQRVSVTGEEKWSGLGVTLFTVACPKEHAAACIRGVSLGPDGYGGAIVVFAVPGNGLDIVAQRLDHFGNPLWQKPHISICDEIGDQMRPLVGSDGKGGAFIAWQDYRKGAGVGDLFLQHIDEGGRAQWEKCGVPLFPWIRDQYPVSLRPDGKGGVWTTWYDIAGGSRYNLWSVHMSEKGQSLTKKPFWWVDQW